MMITEKQYGEAQKRTLEYFEKAGIVITEKEKGNIKVADFGLGELAETGLELIVHVNTERVWQKSLFYFHTKPVPNIVIHR